MINTITISAVILEVIVYLIYVIYLIYRPIKMKIMKKKLIQIKKIIQNPPSVAAFALPYFSLVICLPSIFVLVSCVFGLLNANSWFEDLMGIIIYFSIFVTFISLGFRLLFSAKGDYYLEEDGIHFICNERFVIRYCDIEKSKWFERNYNMNNIPVNSMTKILVNHRHFKFYNLPEDKYVRYISSENIFIRNTKISLFLKIVITIYTFAFICSNIYYIFFMNDISSTDGPGMLILAPTFVLGVGSIVIWQTILNSRTILKSKQ